MDEEDEADEDEEDDKQPIFLNSEMLFALAVNNNLNNNGANWKIIKSKYKYCYIDFILINLNNLYSVYIEYKERQYAYGYTSYDTFFISLRKYHAIKKNYNNCYIVFDFTHSTQHDDEFYFIKYDEKLFNTFEQDLDKSKLHIPREKCYVGFENLINLMVHIIPNNNI